MEKKSLKEEVESVLWNVVLEIEIRVSQKLPLSIFRTGDGNHWRARGFHREWLHHQPDMCREILPRTSCLYLLES